MKARKQAKKQVKHLLSGLSFVRSSFFAGDKKTFFAIFQDILWKINEIIKDIRRNFKLIIY